MELFFYLAFLCLFVPTILGSLCVWEKTISSWSTGYRSLLYISLEEDASAWNVTMMFDAEITFEAWKGDVTQLSRETYSVTSKCYNNVLYACQCLELGFLVKHDGGIPQASFLFNGSPAPPCPGPPLCDGVRPATEPASTQTPNIDNDPEHPCLRDPTPCHPEAICLVETGDSYNCTCLPTFHHTGADLFDSTSNVTACQVSNDSPALNDTSGLANETASVDELLNSLLANASALDVLLIQMAQFEDADLEDFIAAVFNSTENTALIVAAVGDNPVAIMALWDAIGNNTEAQQVYLEALGNLASDILASLNSSSTTLDPILGFTLPENFTIGDDLLGLLGNLSNNFDGLDLGGLGGFGK